MPGKEKKIVSAVLLTQLLQKNQLLALTPLYSSYSTTTFTLGSD
jgi:hypothetical protein